MRLILAAAALAALTATPALSASFTTFTDRAAFEAAVGAGLTVETFDSVLVDTSFGGGGSATVGAVTMSATLDIGGYNMIDAPSVTAEVNVNGTTALNVGTLGSDTATMSFASSIFAFGADFFNFNDGVQRTRIEVGADVLLPPVTPSYTPTFFGFISDAAFSSLQFTALQSDAYGIDNVSFATATSDVPVPAAAPMLLAGIAGLGLLRRRARG
ncbi:VPLPA-CTERM sorting domain-containing protein [Rhodovulum sp. DZ06]|uniref:VPLPA-CTERM sorting domain-containing protein n=1 Tax=Rhodovulum sp. DZ06 TaxID=3425126 RepID=UPI003D3560A8